jgi:hypothetical protein
MGGPWSEQTGQKVRPYLKNNQSKKDWKHGTHGRVTASE